MEGYTSDGNIDNEYDQIIFQENVAVVQNGQQEDVDDAPDKWITDNSKQIMNMYEDIKYQSMVTGIMDCLTCHALGSFLDRTDTSERIDEVKWSDMSLEDVEEIAKPLPGKAKPTLKQWMAFQLTELLQLFRYLNDAYPFFMDSFEEFCEFAYVFSKSKLRLSMVE